MKILFFLFISTFTFISVGQNKNTDSTNIKKTREHHKRFGFGGTPILAFDSDLGLKYGAVINFFDYGNKFPKYLQYAKIKAFHTTNGTSNLSLIYDNNSLLKKTKFIFESTYTKDVLLNFYGFNGTKSNYNHSIKDSKSIEYINPYYYTHQRQTLKFRLDFQRQINTKKLYLLYGFNFNKYMIDKTDLSKFDFPIGANQTSNNTSTLFEDYIESKIIPTNEIYGGTFVNLKLGITFDTRNNQINCSDGIFLETYLINTPKLMGSEGFTKYIITFRQYYMIKKINTLITYRISSQQKLEGKIPYFYLPTYHDLTIDNDGLGGAYNLRGVSRNRIAANGFIVGNLEVRKNILNFNFLKQSCKIEVSGFTDFAYITQEYQFNSDMIISNLFNKKQQKLNYTYGAGAYLIYNTNNIISANFGISPDKSLGSTGLYIGASFLF